MSDEQTDKVASIRALFDECYEQAAPFFRRAAAVQEAYEQGPESERGADVNFPLIWQLVESALPTVWSGAFPRQNFVQAVSRRPMGFEERFALERYAEHQIEMSGLKIRGLQTVKDALKFGRGYGCIEMDTVSVPTEVISVLIGQGGVEAGTVQRRDNLIRVPTYKRIPYQFVTPTPETDDPDKVSGVFIYKPITETQLRAMYDADEALPLNERSLKLSAKAVLQKTKEKNLNAAAWPLDWMYAQLSGNSDAITRMRNMDDIVRSQNMYDRKSRIMIVPVLQCKFQSEEIWIANGDQIIYEQRGDKAIRKDFVSVSVFPDSDNWWCNGIGSRSLDLDEAENIIFRMILDIAARYGDPVKTINTTLLENPPDNVNPGDVLKARMMTSSQRVLEYVTGPDIPQSMMALGMQMVDQGTRTAGINPQAMGQGSPGVMRAGSGGFESWLATATGREKLMENSVRTSWLIPSIELIMLHTRLNMAPKEEFSLYDVKRGEYVQKSVTRDAFNAVMEWKLNTEAKYDLSTQEKGMRLSTYVQTMKDNPMFDQEAAVVWATGDDPAMERLIATPEKRKAQEEALQRRAEAQQQAQQGQPEAGMESPATQGMMANM
jgi:hypothetical protein